MRSPGGSLSSGEPGARGDFGAEGDAMERAPSIGNNHHSSDLPRKELLVKYE